MDKNLEIEQKFDELNREIQSTIKQYESRKIGEQEFNTTMWSLDYKLNKIYTKNIKIFVTDKRLNKRYKDLYNKIFKYVNNCTL